MAGLIGEKKKEMLHMMIDFGGNRLTLEKKQSPALCLNQVFTENNKTVIMFVESTQIFDDELSALIFCKENDLQLIKWPFSPEDVLKMQIGFGE